ncbi:MAG: TonB family protein [Bacteroidota bacterium]
MNDLFIYLIKVSLGLAIIAVPYYFLFRNDPSLALKRFYLLAGLLASWIFPFLVFRRPEVMLNLTPTVFIDPSAEPLIPSGITTSASAIDITVNWIRVSIMVYLSGLIFLLIKNLWIILRWNLSWHKNRDENGIAFTGSDQVFTIFTRIFIPGSLRNEQDLENILLHEKAHIQQLHFIDLTLMELTLLLTWFNPFSWLISRMIKENHEHLADRQVLSAGVNPARYRAQLLNHTLGVNVFRLGNQFNHSLTLKRFKMMKKPEKSPLGIIKIALLIPAVLITMGLTTGMKPQPQKTIKGKVILADCGEPAVGAAVVIANSTTGTVVDLDGTFMLNVDGDPELVISFVGYGTLRKKASEAGKKTLYLEVQPYTVDPEDVPAGNISYSATNSMTFHTAGDSDESPVIVLDGEVVITMDNIDSESIESIEVFKDPDSEIVKKYNAKNGVVLITSKKSEDPEGKEKTGILRTEEEVFYVVEEMPMFPQGRAALKNYIYSRLVYPENMKKKGISGEVYVQFLVKGSGKLEDISVASSTHKEFEAPALAVFNDMPDWNPGKQRGKAVKVRVMMPIRFNAEK